MMRRSWATLALTCVMTAVVVAPVSSAWAQRSSDETRIDHILLKDTDIVSAVRVLMQRSGVQIMFEAGTEPYNKIVALNLDDVTVENAIGYICKAAGAFFRRDENGVYIISHNKEALKPEAKAPAASAVKLLKRIKMLHANSRDVYDMILYQIPFSSERGFEELRRFTSDATANRNLEKLFGNSNLSIQQSTQQFTPVNARSSTPLTGGESGNDITLPGESARQGGLGGGLGGGGGQRGGGGQGQGGTGAQLQPGTGLVPGSIDFISYDPTDNSIVVRGTEEDIAELQRNITMFDVAPRQVQIKVEFVTTTENLAKSLGYDFLYARGPLFVGNRPGSFARSSDPIFLNYATGNVTSRLRSLLSENRGHVVSAPILRTLNNQPASISSSITTFIFINQTVVSNGTVITTSTPQALLAQTVLSVAPRINDDGTITVYLNPSVQNFVGVSISPDGNSFPNIVNQSLSVVARVKNGETIVLGGLAQKNDNNTLQRIPILSDLPIIGQFFRSTTHDKTNSDLLIFVTPTIIEDEESGGGGL